MLLFAFDRERRLIHVDDGCQKTNKELFCPYCGARVIAKLGSIKRYHFAHIEQTCGGEARDAFGYSLALFDEAVFTGAGIRLPASFINSLVGKLTFDAYSEARYLSNRAKYLWQDALEQAILKGLVSPTAVKGQYAKTELWLALEGKLTLSEFANAQEQVAKDWIMQYRNEDVVEQTVTSTVDRELLYAFLQRQAKGSLYFLKLQVVTKEGGTKGLYKIGMTCRSLEERIKEIENDIGKYAELIDLEKLYELPGRASIEHYFKCKYRQFQHSIGPLTEYFSFSDNIANVSLELEELKEKALPRRVSGILNRLKSSMPAGRPKGKESEDKLLAKHQDVVMLLQKELSLREVARMSKKSVNTVKKVKALIR